jgi:hypothetical protein
MPLKLIECDNMKWFGFFFNKRKYRQNDVCIYEEVPGIKVAVYDGYRVDKDKFIIDFTKDSQIKDIKKEQRNQLSVFQIKTNMRRFNPNEYSRQKYLFDNGSIIHAGEIGEFYGKSTKMKRFFYNKRKNIV